MEYFLLLFVWLFPAFIVHAFYAISLTASQRLGLLAAISREDPDAAIAKMDISRDVSFDAHLWRVITLRSPWSIYPRELRAEIRDVA